MSDNTETQIKAQKEFKMTAVYTEDGKTFEALMLEAFRQDILTAGSYLKNMSK